jgi:hypothetical protein
MLAKRRLGVLADTIGYGPQWREAADTPWQQ